jgi:hypothetical protein
VSSPYNIREHSDILPGGKNKFTEGHGGTENPRGFNSSKVVGGSVRRTLQGVHK